MAPPSGRTRVAEASCRSRSAPRSSRSSARSAFRNLPKGRGMQQFKLAQGSGFFISADGYAVTNSHVVANAQSVEISTDNGKTYTAKVVGTDPRTDVAVIKIDGGGNFPYVKFAEAEP